MTDPIVEEVRKIRYEMEKRAGHDIDCCVKMIRDGEKARYCAKKEKTNE